MAVREAVRLGSMSKDKINRIYRLDRGEEPDIEDAPRPRERGDGSDRRPFRLWLADAPWRIRKMRAEERIRRAFSFAGRGAHGCPRW